MSTSLAKASLTVQTTTAPDQLDSLPQRTTVPSLRRELSLLSRLAAPIALTQAGQAMMGVVDTAVVGRAGAVELGGVGLGNGIFFTVSVLGIGAMLGMDPMISQAIGARQPERARQLLWQGVWFAILAALVLCLPLALLPGALRWVGTEPEVVPHAWIYVALRLPGLIPLLVFAGQRAYLQAIGRPGVLAWAAVIANVANLGFDLLFVFGGESLPAWTGPLRWVPAMGAGGAAIASTLCTVLQMGIAAWAISRMKESHASSRRPVKKDLLRAFRIGLPIGLHMTAEVGVFALAGVLASTLGTEELAAHQIALTLASLSFTAAVGIGNAGSVRVGWAIGARNAPAARRSGLVAVAAAGGVMAMAAAVFTIFPEHVAGLMTDRPRVVAAAVPLLYVAAVFQIADGIQGAGAGVLRGMADTRFTFVANLLGHYVVGLPIAMLAAFFFDVGVTGIWWGLCAGLICVAAALLTRFLKLSAKELRPVELG